MNNNNNLEMTELIDFLLTNTKEIFTYDTTSNYNNNLRREDFNEKLRKESISKEEEDVNIDSNSNCNYSNSNNNNTKEDMYTKEVNEYIKDDNHINIDDLSIPNEDKATGIVLYGCKYYKNMVIKGEIKDSNFNGYVHIESNNITIETNIDQNNTINIFNSLLSLIITNKDDSNKSDNYFFYINDDKSIEYISIYKNITENKDIINTIYCKYQAINTNEGFSCVYKDNLLTFGYYENNELNGYYESYCPTTGKFEAGYVINANKVGFNLEVTHRDGNALRFTLSTYENDYLHGPSFSITKTLYKLEVYLYGFKTKSLEKLDAIKRYISLYYPEYNNMFSGNKFAKIMEKYPYTKEERSLKILKNSLVNIYKKEVDIPLNLLMPKLEDTKEILTEDNIKDISNIIKEMKVVKKK